MHECYATKGPIKLATALLASNSKDCLAQESHGADVLKNPEPNFYIIGNKSYGRNSSFLIKIGLQQIKEIYTIITGSPDLKLHDVPETATT